MGAVPAIAALHSDSVVRAEQGSPNRLLQTKSSDSATTQMEASLLESNTHAMPSGHSAPLSQVTKQYRFEPRSRQAAVPVPDVGAGHSDALVHSFKHEQARQKSSDGP